MKRFFLAPPLAAALLAAGGALAAAPPSLANSPVELAQVDLRDKKGIVDPQDLKRHDPKPQPLRTREPPSPQIPRSQAADPPKNPPSDEGGKPGPGASPVRPAPPRSAPYPAYVPPPKPPAKR
jgi:hypothetical protein